MQGHNDLPEVIEKSEDELAKITQEIDASALSSSSKAFIIKCIELATWLPSALQHKNITIARLCKLIFGEGYGRRKKSNPDTPDETDSEDGLTEGSTQETPQGSDKQPRDTNKKKQKGHGRMPHTIYTNCDEVDVKVGEYVAGDVCPTQCGGRLRVYRRKDSAGAVVRVYGQNFARVVRYHIETLRCNLCNYVLKAKLPKEAGTEKYDASFKSILALQKYYVSVPFYRQENFQRLLGFPLPDSTQWDLIEQLAGYCYPIFNLLKYLAANAKLIHNDDTTLRILEIIEAIKSGTHNSDRTGMYTTVIIADYEGNQNALFLNGTQHAGENFADILAKRAPNKASIIQMCDGSNNNTPKEFETIVCNCLSHGFRKFEELIDYFPEECLHILKLLSEVYKNDAKTKGFSDETRLSYHQEHSKPVMEALENYMSSLIDDHIIEPNSALGGAIKYMQRRWKELTRFLEVAGAPLDNNIVERALKIAIRNRKNALFYRTQYSAGIGGMITSLIYTCHLANANAHHYLTVLQKYPNEVVKSPEKWLPWNYKIALESIASSDPATTNDANLVVVQSTQDCLAVA